MSSRIGGIVGESGCQEEHHARYWSVKLRAVDIVLLVAWLTTLQVAGVDDRMNHIYCAWLLRVDWYVSGLRSVAVV